MRTVLILFFGLGGLWLTFSYFRKNWAEIRLKTAGRMRWEDKALNYPLMFLWFGYLFVFFLGLIVNNLFIR